MDAELKAKWVATLRSGNYEQGRKKLRSENNKCCCLGVLCDIADPKEWRPNSPTGAYSHRKQQCLPRDGFCGLARSVITKLANMNDRGKSFSEIADYIEKHL